MQNGPSRELFDLWAPDSRNGLIVTGYSIEGTLARVSGSSGLVHFGECLPVVVVHSCIYSVQQWTIFSPFCPPLEALRSPSLLSTPRRLIISSFSVGILERKLMSCSFLASDLGHHE